MDNIKRSTQIGQILLDFNIIPIELNTLILDYERPNTNDFIGKVATVGYIRSFAIDDLYIYMSCSLGKAIKIFGKYNYTWINTILTFNDKTDKYMPTKIAVDKSNIYVFMRMPNDYSYSGVGHIRIFEKNGTFVKSIETGFYEIVNLSVDDKYIYIASMEMEVIKRLSKNGSKDDKEFKVKSLDIYEKLVHNEYIYIVESSNNIFDSNETIVAYNLENGTNNNYVNIWYTYGKDNIFDSLLASDGNKLYFYGKTKIKQLMESDKLLPIVLVPHYKIADKENRSNFCSMKVDDDYIYLLEDSGVYILAK